MFGHEYVWLPLSKKFLVVYSRYYLCLVNNVLLRARVRMCVEFMFGHIGAIAFLQEVGRICVLPLPRRLDFVVCVLPPPRRLSLVLCVYFFPFSRML